MVGAWRWGGQEVRSDTCGDGPWMWLRGGPKGLDFALQAVGMMAGRDGGHLEFPRLGKEKP